jgi:predicted aspartyl protease
LSVPALANHLSANLLLDTGAAYSSITPQVAARLRLTIIGSQSVLLGGSIGLSYPEVELTTFRVGTLDVPNFRVLVMSFDPSLGINGILGMDFLHRFRFTVEPDTTTLVLRALKK